MFPVYRSCPLGIYHVCKSSSGCLPNGAGRGLGLETTQMLAFRRDNIGAADARPPVLALEFRMVRAIRHRAVTAARCQPEGQALCTRKRVEYNVPRIVDPHGWEHNRSSGKKVEAACLVLLARFGRYCTESGVDTLASGGVWTPSTFGPQRLDLWWPSC